MAPLRCRLSLLQAAWHGRRLTLLLILLLPSLPPQLLHGDRCCRRQRGLFLHAALHAGLHSGHLLLRRRVDLSGIPARARQLQPQLGCLLLRRRKLLLRICKRTAVLLARLLSHRHCQGCHRPRILQLLPCSSQLLLALVQCKLGALRRRSLALRLCRRRLQRPLGVRQALLW